MFQIKLCLFSSFYRPQNFVSLIFVQAKSLYTAVWAMKGRAVNALYALFCSHMLVFTSSWHTMVRVEGAAGAVRLMLSAPVVYADEGLSSHFGITQNPMNSCLLAQ